MLALTTITLPPADHATAVWLIVTIQWGGCLEDVIASHQILSSQAGEH